MRRVLKAVSVIFCLYLVVAAGWRLAYAQKATGNLPTHTKINRWLHQSLQKEQEDTTMSDLITFFARKQIGIPYEANMLDKSPIEKLVVDLTGEDCVIYVENTMALTLTALEHDSTISRFSQNLEHLRYRDGKLNGYASRLNYFSDWLLNNQKRGNITILSQKWPGTAKMDSIYFMSTHRYDYPQLIHSDSLFRLIKKRESYLSHDGLRYLPKMFLPRYVSKIHSGDIIAFVTTVAGLDVSHTAIALRSGNFLTFIHANPKHGVIIEPLGLLPYVLGRKTIKGVIIARLRSEQVQPSSLRVPQKDHRTSR
ncbi:MAG TPA: N-acetylmuramoyl-L-alanine amidase-like domain-containing protein [Balneolales bacterium]|nr:N-acetylmuramoyl-L-alanine amidase-like domain-containing protein [Balneolales bacterium]